METKCLGLSNLVNALKAENAELKREKAALQEHEKWAGEYIRELKKEIEVLREYLTKKEQAKND